ncbi:MAG: hypothetical protein QM747_07250 [Nocardioides sp.]
MAPHRTFSPEEFERLVQLSHLYSSLVRLLGLGTSATDPGARALHLPSIQEVYDEVARLKLLAESAPSGSD